MSLAILFHFLCTQHVSDINMSIIRSLRRCCWINTSVVVFSVRCVLEIWCGWVCNTHTTQTKPHQISNTQRTKNTTTDVVIQQQSRKLLMMDILMCETCWAHKKWNKRASDIIVFYSSTRSCMFTVRYEQSLNSIHINFVVQVLDTGCFEAIFREQTQFQPFVEIKIIRPSFSLPLPCLPNCSALT